jgi:hypothetical protein
MGETRRGAGADLCLHIYCARPVGIDIDAQFNTGLRRKRMTCHSVISVYQLADSSGHLSEKSPGNPNIPVQETGRKYKVPRLGGELPLRARDREQERGSSRCRDSRETSKQHTRRSRASRAVHCRSRSVPWSWAQSPRQRSSLTAPRRKCLTAQPRRPCLYPCP